VVRSAAAGTLDSSPRLKLIQAWAVNLTYGPHEALALVERLETQQMADAEGEAQLLALRPCCWHERQDRSILRPGPGAAALIKPEFAFARSMLAQTLANTSMILGNLTEAGAMPTRRASCRHPRPPAQLCPGRFGRRRHRPDAGASETSHGAAASGRRVSGEDIVNSTSRNAYSGVLLAEALYERAMSNGERLLGVFVPWCSSWACPTT